MNNTAHMQNILRSNYELVELSKITESKYNPVLRTDRSSSQYKQLKASIQTNGLIVPIVLNSEYKVVDGHRRLNCFKDLGCSAIPAFINRHVDNDNYDYVFMITNKNSMKINAAQETERYLAGATEISPKILKAIKSLEEIGGTKCIQRVVDDKKSPNTFLIGISMYCSYTKKKTRKDQRKCLYWMLNVGTAYRLKTAMNFFIPAEILIDCVENRKDITAKWTGQ